MEALKVQAYLLEMEKQRGVDITIKKELEALYNDWKDITIKMLKDYDDDFCFYDDFENDSDKIVEYIYNAINKPFKQVVQGLIYNLEKGSKLDQMQILEMAKEMEQKELFHRLNHLCDDRKKKKRL